MISMIHSPNGCWLKPALISCANRSEAAIQRSAFALVCLVYNAFCVVAIANGLIFTLRSVAGLEYLRPRLRMRIRPWSHDPFGGPRSLKFALMGPFPYSQKRTSWLVHKS